MTQKKIEKKYGSVRYQKIDTLKILYRFWYFFQDFNKSPQSSRKSELLYLGMYLYNF